MFYDLIPLPSKGYFYENKDEYIKVFFMTTEDELMMTNINLFAKGDALNILLEKNVCKPNNLKLNDLLLIDKEFLILYLKEIAYGNITDDKDDKFYFDTHNIKIKTMEYPPEEDGFYHINFNEKIFKIKLIRVSEEKIYKKLSKLNKYIYQIYAIDDNTDKNHIKKFVQSQTLLNGRKLMSMIDKLNFGLNKNTFCILKGKKRDVKIEIDESLFGLKLDNLSKVSKVINKSAFFLINEGDGYTWEEVLRMPVHFRKNHEEQLINKLHKLKDAMKNK